MSEKSPPNLSAWVSENSPPHFCVCEWVRTHLLIFVCVCEWELTSRFECVCVSVSSPPDFSVWVSENSPPDLSVCVWVRENSPPHLCLWVRERTHLPSALPSNHTLDNLLANRILDGRTDRHTRFSAETLNPDTPKRIPITLSDTLTLRDTLTLSDTHYTEWYPLRTHPRRYPLHWVIFITDTPKRTPFTLNDTHYTEWYPLQTHPRGYPLHWMIPITLSDFSSHWQFSQPTQEFTHYTEGPCFPHKQTAHWVIPMTLRDIPDTEWYPLPWVSSQ